MWFNNALIYHCEFDDTLDLNELLSEDKLKPCPPHARFIYGWLPVTDDQFTHTIAGASLISLGKEERILPRGVVQQLLNEKIEALEAQRGYAVKRAEKAQLAEELEFQLLPKSFCLQKRLFAFIDHVHKRLIINTSSATAAAQLTSLLRKSIPSMHIEPLAPQENIASCLTTWVSQADALSSAFQLASQCVLTDLSDDKKRFHCKGYELPADEVLTLIEQGLNVTEIALTWQDRIEFTLTHDFTFKRLKCMDYLVDAFQETRKEEGIAEKDAALTLLVGEWRAFFHDISKALLIHETTPTLEKMTLTETEEAVF